MSRMTYSQVMMAVTQGQTVSETDYIKISGDAPLDYVLERINTAGEPKAGEFLKRLRDGYYD